MCVEVADGRTDGRCGPRKGGAAVGKRICGLGISNFFCCYFTYWRQQGRRTTESYYRFWACSAHPPALDWYRMPSVVVKQTEGEGDKEEEVFS